MGHFYPPFLSITYYRLFIGAYLSWPLLVISQAPFVLPCVVFRLVLGSSGVRALGLAFSNRTRSPGWIYVMY